MPVCSRGAVCAGSASEQDGGKTAVAAAREGEKAASKSVPFGGPFGEAAATEEVDEAAPGRGGSSLAVGGAPASRESRLSKPEKEHSWGI
ncbi:hypothetical protein cyc_08604 [Cyclospora cayetanensis]|uniref:Uncharacterized protein n=1 Tax=Cyclospora cayetanensis TaxID=88456 RepID=A0A1D3D989_9EIME|nr:hypothetical protein cyc_08604 [Cyclospora cayetanensis]